MVKYAEDPLVLGIYLLHSLNLKKLQGMLFGLNIFSGPHFVDSFHPETALLSKFCVNLHNCLCDVFIYDSAQLLDFLDFAQNFSFPNW